MKDSRGTRLPSPVYLLIFAMRHQSLLPLVLFAFVRIVTATIYNDPSLVAGQTYDFIVVGAGATGPILAHRLAEVPDWRVLLIEAGGEYVLVSHAGVNSDLTLVHQRPRPRTYCDSGKTTLLRFEVITFIIFSPL